jgi:hypothetical protein
MCIECHEVLVTLYTKPSKRVYRLIHWFRLFFAQFPVPRFDHIYYIKMGVLKDL